MTKKCCLLILMFIFFTTGCIKNIKTPSDTIKSPIYNEKDKIFNVYKKNLRENNSSGELLEFLKKYISKISEQNADISVIRIIELQENLLPKYEEKLFSEEYLKNLKQLEDGEQELHDFPKEFQDWVNETEDNGYKVTSIGIKIDYENINKITANYLSEELKDYIKIESDDYISSSNYNYSEKEYLDELVELKPNKNSNELVKIKIDKHLNELAKRISQTYIYIDKHKNSPYILRVKELRKMYLEIYFFGSPNNPSFEHYKGYKLSENTLKSEWRKKYISLENDSKDWENTLKTDKKTSLSKQFSVEISNYVTELNKNNFILNETTNKEIYEIIKP